MDLHSELGDLLNVPSWYKQANCRGEDQDLFFPERGSSTIKAKAICSFRSRKANYDNVCC